MNKDQNITYVLTGLRTLRECLDQMSPDMIAIQLDGLIDELEPSTASGDVLVVLMKEFEEARSDRDVGRALQGFLNWLMEHFRCPDDWPESQSKMVYEVIYRLYRAAKHMRRYG